LIIDGVKIRFAGEQGLSNLRKAHLGRNMQSSSTARCFQVRIGPVIEQQLRRVSVPAHHCPNQRRISLKIVGIDFNSRIQESPHNRDVPIPDRIHEGRPLARVVCVWIRFLAQQILDFAQFSIGCGANQRR
jgi:hypothetical protein